MDQTTQESAEDMEEDSMIFPVKYSLTSLQDQTPHEALETTRDVRRGGNEEKLDLVNGKSDYPANLFAPIVTKEPLILLLM